MIIINGALGDRRLTQPGRPQDRQQGACPGIDVVAVRGPQRGGDLGTSQPRRPRRIRSTDLAAYVAKLENDVKTPA